MSVRCSWCEGDEQYERYHDEEWGVPVRDDQKLFEMLLLEGAQAGLSWLTVLRKRDHYQKVFDGFDPEKIAKYDTAKREQLLADPGIIRNKLKVNAFIVNAQLYLDLQAKAKSGKGPTFSDYIWSFVDGETKVNSPETMKQVPITTHESDALSKSLKKMGFKFVGSTICYAFMQAAGLVDDHVKSCFKHGSLT